MRERRETRPGGASPDGERCNREPVSAPEEEKVVGWNWSRPLTTKDVPDDSLAMSTRRDLYVAGFVAASLAYIFVSLAFTGSFHLLRWITFVVFFGVAFAGFEWFIGWAMAQE